MGRGRCSENARVKLMLSFLEFCLQEDSVWYHGTSSKFLPQIRQRGLQPSRGQGATAWLAQVSPMMGLLAKQNLKNGVYVTQNKGLAKAFAKAAAEATGGTPALLTLELPYFQGIKDDDDAMHASYIYPGAIPPTYIKSVAQGSSIRAPKSYNFI